MRTNRSELDVGYFTKNADTGVDLLPIGDLVKTEVWQLARVLGVPEEIIEKAPSGRSVGGSDRSRRVGD